MQNYREDDKAKFDDAVSASGNLMDSRTSQLDDVLNEKLEDAFDQPASQFLLHDIAKIASEYDPIDLAYAVSRLPPSARIIVYENLPDLQSKIIFMSNTGNNTRAAIFPHISDKEIKELLDQMPPDEAAWLLDDLSDRRMRKVLDLLDPKKAATISGVYEHDRNSAGRLMSSEFFSFHMNSTLGEIAEVIRDNPGIDVARRIFIVHDDGELIGFVPVRNLIINPAHLPARQVMRPVLHYVQVDSSRDEVVDLVERYKIPDLPVVDADHKLVGIISYETVVEAMEDIADETIGHIGGTIEDVREHESIYKRFFWRAPWLIVTLCAGLLTATVMSYFKDKEWFTVVALFVPLIAGMSGNVGIQCSTVLVRAMSLGELSHGSKRAAFLSELGIGLLIGVVFGLLCAGFMFFLNLFKARAITGADPLGLGITVSFGLLGACFMATLLGSLAPFAFARLRIDPTVASGPIVTAFNDVLCTLMYIFIAKLVGSFLY